MIEILKKSIHETGNVAVDLATLLTRYMETWQVNTWYAFRSNSLQSFGCPYQFFSWNRLFLGRSENEQRCVIRFCFRLGHSATETFAKLQQAYKDSVSVEAQSRSGMPSILRTMKILTQRILASMPKSQQEHFCGFSASLIARLESLWRILRDTWKSPQDTIF